MITDYGMLIACIFEHLNEFRVGGHSFHHATVWTVCAYQTADWPNTSQNDVMMLP